MGVCGGERIRLGIVLTWLSGWEIRNEKGHFEALELYSVGVSDTEHMISMSSLVCSNWESPKGRAGCLLSLSRSLLKASSQHSHSQQLSLTFAPAGRTLAYGCSTGTVLSSCFPVLSHKLRFLQSHSTSPSA